MKTAVEWVRDLWNCNVEEQMIRVVQAAMDQARAEAFRESAKIICPHTVKWNPGTGLRCCHKKEEILTKIKGKNRYRAIYTDLYDLRSHTEVIEAENDEEAQTKIRAGFTDMDAHVSWTQIEDS